jgi:hypothetical protein
MSIRNMYCGLPLYFALPLAFLASAIIAMTLAALGVFTTEFLLNEFNGPDGPAAGVLVILIALNIAVPAFVALVSILVSLHHRSSWRIPALAFLFCIVLIRMLGAFDFQFAPFVLGTGAVACLVSCWLLRGKEHPLPKHVVET